MALMVGNSSGVAVEMESMKIGDENGKPIDVVDMYVGDANGVPQLAYRNMNIAYAAEYEALDKGQEIASMKSISSVSEASAPAGYTAYAEKDEDGNIYQDTDPGSVSVESKEDITNKDTYDYSKVYYEVQS